MTDVSHRQPDDDRRQMPPWLMGLIIAAVLFIIGFFVFGALGFGDDPAIEESMVIPLLAFEAARPRHRSG